MNDDSPGEPPAAVSDIAGPEAVSDTELPSLAVLATAADPTLVGLLGAAQPTLVLDDGIPSQADGHVYDGHVALVLDPESLPGMDSTLDLLTTSTDLFDVPAMDIGGEWNDATST